MNHRGTSPMPNNIDDIKNSMPYGAVMNIQNWIPNQPLFYRALNGIRRNIPKILTTGALAGTLYGAYKLGANKEQVMNRLSKFRSLFSRSSYPQSNYTRSDT